MRNSSPRFVKEMSKKSVRDLYDGSPGHTLNTRLRIPDCRYCMATLNRRSFNVCPGFTSSELLLSAPGALDTQIASSIECNRLVQSSDVLRVDGGIRSNSVSE